MTIKPADIVQRLWSYCNVLRDDGISYSDYVEQITYLIFLKMAHERQQIQGNGSTIPLEYSWSSLCALSGAALARHYGTILAELAHGSGSISLIFGEAQNRIQDPAKLRRLVELIDSETWTGSNRDIPGEIYEGLLEKNAQDIKSGAGQYFTPRPLISAIVDVMRPQPGQTICDPACGSGGFLIAAHDYIVEHHQLTPEQIFHLNHRALHGWEIVANTARSCAMNFHLRGIAAGEGDRAIRIADALTTDPGDRFDIVLTNPPFGKKSSVTYVTKRNSNPGSSPAAVRDDFWASTSNKQLNFVQHIKTILKAKGRAAVVVPDNVLFEGGAGETIRRNLLHACEVHTLLRLPTGIFYAPGVRANVLFFDRGSKHKSPQTQSLWVYDMRTNRRFTLKRSPLNRTDLDEFVVCYNPQNRRERVPTWSPGEPNGRWRAFTFRELMARDRANLDIFWLRDESVEGTTDLPDPDVLVAEILDDLETALAQFRAIVEDGKYAV